MELEPELEQSLKQRLSNEMEETVELLAFVEEGDESREVLEKLASLSPKVELNLEGPDSPEAKEVGIDKTPALVVGPGKLQLSYQTPLRGQIPWALVETVVRISRGESGLAEGSKSSLEWLKENRKLEVFVARGEESALAALIGGMIAVEGADKVKVSIESPDHDGARARELGIDDLPALVIDGSPAFVGVPSEKELVSALVEI